MANVNFFSPDGGTTRYPIEDTEARSRIAGQQNQLNAQGVLGAKNLLPQVEHANTTMTINGVTITSQEDGSVLLNGTSTAAVAYHFIRLPSDANRKFIKQVAGKKVTISGTNVSNTNARVQFWSATTNVMADTTGKGTTFTIPSDLATTGDYNFAIYILSGVTLNNIIVYPMLRLASDPDDTYQPYAMTNRELTENTLDLMDNVFRNQRLLTTSDDLNNTNLPQGVYLSQGVEVINKPSDIIGWWHLINIKTGGFLQQFIIAGTAIYTRYKGGSPSAWSSWRSFTGTIVS